MEFLVSSLRKSKHKQLDFCLLSVLILLSTTIGITIANGELFSFKTALLLALLLFIGFLLNPEKWFWVVPVVILLPLHLGKVAGIPRLLLEEVVIPLFIGALLVREVIKRDFLQVFSIRHNPLNLPVFLFFGVVFLNYFRRPLMPANLLGLPSEAGGLRTYYSFFLGVSTYLITLHMCSDSFETVKKVLKLLLYLSTLICLLGISMYIFNFSLPGIDILRWSVHEISYGAVRIGFIGGFGQLGLLLLLPNLFHFRWRFSRYILGFLFTVSLFLSGGRAVVVATLVAIIAWLFIRKRYVLFTSAVVVTVIIYISLPVIYSAAPNPQIRRLVNIQSMQESSIGRYYIYKYSIHEFLRSPLFGVGLGKVYNVPRSIPLPSDFLERELRIGGHATYAALLRYFGLVGVFPFIAIFLVSFANCFKIGRTTTAIQERYLRRIEFEIPELATFFGLYIVAHVVAIIAGGYATNIFTYLILGMIGALINLRNKA